MLAVITTNEESHAVARKLHDDAAITAILNKLAMTEGFQLTADELKHK